MPLAAQGARYLVVFQLPKLSKAKGNGWKHRLKTMRSQRHKSLEWSEDPCSRASKFHVMHTKDPPLRGFLARFSRVFSGTIAIYI